MPTCVKLFIGVKTDCIDEPETDGAKYFKTEIEFELGMLHKHLGDLDSEFTSDIGIPQWSFLSEGERETSSPMANETQSVIPVPIPRVVSALEADYKKEGALTYKWAAALLSEINDTAPPNKSWAVILYPH